MSLEDFGLVLGDPPEPSNRGSQTRPYVECWWVCQLSNGRFFNIRNPRGGPIRITVQFGCSIGGNPKQLWAGITEEKVIEDLEAVCRLKGVPMPVGFRMRQIKAEIIE